MKRLLFVACLAIAIWAFITANNKWLMTTEYTITSAGLPEAFEGARIVQISDLHNAEFGEGQEALIERVKRANPDIVFLTGDLIDSNRYNLEAVLPLIDTLVSMNDVYFVAGNHEISSNKLEEVQNELEARGVTVLQNETVVWERDGQHIQLAGIMDPLMDVEVSPEDYTEQALAEASFGEGYVLLLAHRPEMLEEYAEAGVNLVFSGHAHGGQIRIPGVGGLIAPGQGWLPNMTEGVFREGDTQLVLSRGLGNSGFPLRIFNRPEVVAVTLQSE